MKSKTDKFLGGGLQRPPPAHDETAGSSEEDEWTEEKKLQKSLSYRAVNQLLFNETENLKEENVDLQREVRYLRRKLARVELRAKKLAVLEKETRSTSRRWTMLNIAFAFVAGAVFVAADYTWGASQFNAGVLYAVGSLLLVLAVPALHATGTVRHVGYKWWQPFVGGVRFVVLQILSWSFYALAVLLLVGAVYYGDRAVGWLTGGGVLGILSQVLMASSLQTFVAPATVRDGDSASPIFRTPALLGSSYRGPLGRNNSFRRYRLSELHLGDDIDDKPMYRIGGRNSSFCEDFEDELADDDGKANTMDNFAQLLTMNVLLILVMIGLSMVSELVGMAMPAVLSLLVTCVAILLTHGLGGRLLGLDGWSFYQPFSGGTQFVVLQAITWVLFTVSLICQLVFLYAVAYLGLKLTMGLMHIGGVAALASELLCILSFRYFKDKKSLDKGKTDEDITSDTLSELPKDSLVSVLVVLVIWNLQWIPMVFHVLLALIPYFLPTAALDVLEPHCFGVVYRDVPAQEVIRDSVALLAGVMTWALLFGVLETLGVSSTVRSAFTPPWPPMFALLYKSDSRIFPMLCLLAGIWVIYMTTYIGEPEKGKRERRRAGWMNWTSFWDRIGEYFGGRVLLSKELQELMSEGKGPADPKAQFMVGYHPHGIMPSGVAWGILCSEWKRSLPNFQVTALTASIMHFVPLMRDILQWNGVREVSKQTLLRTIDQGLNPMVVVGGQAEMFMSNSRDKTISIVKFHNGFFKIACEQQLPCIPIFTFGETLIIDNIEMPTMQQWFKARVGFPIPFIPIGRWGLPVPRRCKVVVSVGAPITPPPGPVTVEKVTDFKNKYFKALDSLFDEFKDKAGHHDHAIRFVDSK
ncbi:Diacylglycerol O-acyltransferase 1 [Diplonema papillatum]|nr:Diacylglycerol O-acyltransferase 1 [Diplonema papillatum]|eukprot:gene5570-8483_t